MEENNNGINGVLNTPDETAQFSQQDIETNKVMALLSYLSFLVLVPIFGAKESPYARFHANQGLILFIATVAVSVVFLILGGILAFMGSIGAIISIFASVIEWAIRVVIFVFSILGIVNAVQGKAKKLPVVGNFTILK